MKRILYIWQAGYPWDVRVEKICSALRDNGFEVIILARWKPGQKEHETLDGMHIVRVGYRLPSQMTIPVSLNPLWYQAIRKSIDKFQPSLVIAREILLAEAAAKLSHRSGIPVIMDMAEHYPAAMREWKKYMHNPFLRFLVQTAQVPDYVEKKAINASDGIITVCQENSNRLHTQYQYPYDALQVVHNTPSRKLFADIELHYTLPSRQFAHHGFLTEERGLSLFLQGFKLALQQHPSMKLTLAGEGESYNDLRLLIEQLALQQSVILSGGYTYSDIMPMYTATDVGILPYRNDEFRNHTIPNKLFDYMACGKPLLVSQTKPMQRIIEETQAGIAVDCSQPITIAQGIITLLESNTISMGKNGRKAFLEKYNWENDAGHLLEFLQYYL